MSEPVPEGVDLDHPNPARIYDWFLGGTTNWAIDREFGAKVVETFPLVRTMARVGREFLGRGVRHLASQGITQFLDLGSGVPTVGNVHEIADSVNPGSRCVYVDNEPVAVAHSRVLLERQGDPARHAVLHGDLRHADGIWERALATGVLDPSRPVGLIVVNVLYFFGDGDRPYDFVARYRDLLPSGSYLLSSHLTEDGVPREGSSERARVRSQYQSSGSPLHLRTREEFTRFFDGFDLVEPGVVWVPLWQPDVAASPASEEFADEPSASSAFAALGRKP
ncbi:O-methyltransferase involved in polyketide biosynthesis [Saccharomonospora amisosensis]|uniref:O-methyltransferase involved in polyketide biosynthesis n=1 Tax=Saccharomonospora amisosensis TaxID=1128677 RepID=A0A7X5UN11_9PSEU|nr:SAM-dependent methyltransferase [Saccharomonospora amisosensis]NIJ11010.1 O-methyltransferase involved in polyketide biosynthesis [Saccharomonospora amisosensis]